jgi:hypothetical protein
VISWRHKPLRFKRNLYRYALVRVYITPRQLDQVLALVQDLKAVEVVDGVRVLRWGGCTS